MRRSWRRGVGELLKIEGRGSSREEREKITKLVPWLLRLDPEFLEHARTQVERRSSGELVNEVEGILERRRRAFLVLETGRVVEATDLKELTQLIEVLGLQNIRFLAELSLDGGPLEKVGVFLACADYSEFCEASEDWWEDAEPSDESESVVWVWQEGQR